MLLPDEEVRVQCEKTGFGDKIGTVLEVMPDKLSFLLDIEGKLLIHARFMIRPLEGGISDQDQDQGQVGAHSAADIVPRRSERLKNQKKESCVDPVMKPMNSVSSDASTASCRGDAIGIRDQHNPSECRRIFVGQCSMGQLRNWIVSHHCRGGHHLLLAPFQGTALLQTLSFPTPLRRHVSHCPRAALLQGSSRASSDPRLRRFCLRGRQMVPDTFRLGKCARCLLAFPRSHAAPAPISPVPSHCPGLRAAGISSLLWLPSPSD